MPTPRKSLALVLLLFIAATTLFYLQHVKHEQTADLIGQGKDEYKIDQNVLAPSRVHPIYQLITANEAEHKRLLERQSKSLEEAVREYRRRYGLPPPPHFDQWYTFAKRRNVRLIDEYDTIHHQLLPFWAVTPEAIRERVRHALGSNGGLIGISIRNGEVTLAQGGGDMYSWQREATPDMLRNFVTYLPDMDLAFNIRDEPRVVLPHDSLERHVKVAKDEVHPRAAAASKLRNGFSPRPADLNAGDRFKEYKTSLFNEYAHQPTWAESILSCPPDSAARRAVLTDKYVDDTQHYTSKDLDPTDFGFLINTTAHSDICHSPSLAHSFGFFDRPNAFDVTHTLIPIFSQSKVSSFQDILYPSPWYFQHRVRYDPSFDGTPYLSKTRSLYWRGSNTGGFSRDGGWRNQHRQRFVSKTMPTGKCRYLHLDPETHEWRQISAPMKNMSRLFDVKFTYIGQCDPGDCDAQKAYFELAPHVNMFEALGSRYVADVDGNAFSGRYYAWLLSHSLVFKSHIFREWHDEWIKSWVHYVPLSLRGDEYVETVRYFDEEQAGEIQGRRLAEQGRQWAQKVLRNEDLEVWYFRLLLEYGRVIDDNREEIGFMSP